jgi:hypothetical protein
MQRSEGANVVAELPTITNKNLGSTVWGLGPAAVVVRVHHPWIYRTLVNMFFVGGTAGRDSHLLCSWGWQDHPDKHLASSCT